MSAEQGEEELKDIEGASPWQQPVAKDEGFAGLVQQLSGLQQEREAE